MTRSGWKRSDGGGEPVTAHATRWVDQLEQAIGKQHSLALIRGGIYQAQGQVEQAAGIYRAAGTYFPIGDEYLRTAQGFAARGDQTRAWRDSIVSKGQQPQKADIHSWFARMLRDAGYAADSDIETRIAQALTSRP
jgi:hypothetical protein